MSGNYLSGIVSLILLCLISSTEAERIAILNFHDEDYPQGLQQAYVGLTGVVQAGLDDGEHEFVERQDVQVALREFELGKLSAARRGNAAIGKWLKADLLISGTLRRAIPVKQVAGAGMGKTLAQFRPVLKSNTPIPNRAAFDRLDIELIDLRRGIVIDHRSVDASGRELGKVFADRVISILQEGISAAVAKKREMSKLTVIAPVDFQQPFVRVGRRNLPLDYFSTAEREFLEFLNAAVDTNEYHVLDFSATGAGRAEDELTVAGLVGRDPASWQALADVYVWGRVEMNPGDYTFTVHVWNGRTPPTVLRRVVSNGVPKEFQERPRDAEGRTYPMDSEEYRRYQDGKRKFNDFPARSCGLALQALARDAVGAISRLDSGEEMSSVRESIALQMSANLDIRDSFVERMVQRQEPLLYEVRKALGYSFRFWSPWQIWSELDTLGVAGFFDPANNMIDEERMILMDHVDSMSLNAAEFDFRSGLRWGAHVDRFGFQTTGGSQTSVRSGGKIEPYLARWLNVWLNLRALAGKPVPMTQGAENCLQNWDPSWLSPWMRDPSVLEMVEEQAQRRVWKTLEYLAEGRIASLTSLMALPSAVADNSTRRFAATSPVSLISAAIDSQWGLVPLERQQEARQLRDRAYQEMRKFAVAYRDAMAKQRTIWRSRQAQTQSVGAGSTRKAYPAAPPAMHSDPALERQRRTALKEDLKSAAQGIVLRDLYPTEELLRFVIPEIELPDLRMSWETFRLPAGARVSSMVADDAGALWCVVSDGNEPHARLGVIGPNSFTLRFHEQRVRHLYSHQGRIFVVTADGRLAVRADDGHFEKLGLINDLPGASVGWISIGDRGVYVQSGRHLFRARNVLTDWETLENSPGGALQSRAAFLSLHLEPTLRAGDEADWIRLGPRLSALTGRWEKNNGIWKDNKGKLIDPFRSMVMADDGIDKAWIGSAVGLFHYDVETDGLRHWRWLGMCTIYRHIHPTFGRLVASLFRSDSTAGWRCSVSC